MFKPQKLLVIISLMISICIWGWGCASKSYVKKQTQELEYQNQTNKAQIDELKSRLATTDAKAAGIILANRNGAATIIQTI